MANSVHPDETAHYEPSHLDLHCLQRYLCWSAGMKGLTVDSVFIYIYEFLVIVMGKGYTFKKGNSC